MSTKHCCNEQTLLTHLHTLRSILIKRPRVAGFALCPSSQDSHRTENARERRRRERAMNTRVRAHGARAISRHTRYMILYCLHNLFIIYWFSLIPLFHLLNVPFFSFVDIHSEISHYSGACTAFDHFKHIQMHKFTNVFTFFVIWSDPLSPNIRSTPEILTQIL